MQVPSKTPHEEARLRTLRALAMLDTPAGSRFDRLTRLAARIFQVPIALVSLVDEDRQWFKSRYGLTASETSRDISFCGHAILGDDILIVPDTWLDQRFADNPLVTNEPHVRFYAGCPLVADDGNKLGTLCIFDHEPRSLSEADCSALRDLAALVEHELDALELTMMDELTHMLNRRGFCLIGQHALNVCISDAMAASLVFIDLTHLTRINGRFGLAEGERIVAAFANLIKYAIRDSELCARLSDNEFVLFMPDVTKPSAEQVVTRLQLLLVDYNQAVSQPYQISFTYQIMEHNRDRHPTIASMLKPCGSIAVARIKAQEPTT